jgi:hypothetical protein
MKTIIQKILCAVLISLPNYGLAQTLGYTQATDIDVNGIFIGGTYTKAQVQAQWGGATQYWSNMSENGLDESYDYSINQLNNQFLFGENGTFHTFNIRVSNFAVYTAFSGGIKVGDNISRIQSIGLGTPVLQSNGAYKLWRNNGEDPITFHHSNGIITRIYFMTSI